MTVHELKCWPEFFDAIRSGRKTFDIRKNDRGFQTGDRILFRKFDPEKGQYTHPDERLTVKIAYVLNGLGLQNGYICMGISPPQGQLQTDGPLFAAMRKQILDVLRHAEVKRYWVEVELYGGCDEKRQSRHLITQGFPIIDDDGFVCISDDSEDSWWYSVAKVPNPEDPPSIIGVTALFQYPPAKKNKEKKNG